MNHQEYASSDMTTQLTFVSGNLYNDGVFSEVIF